MPKAMRKGSLAELKTTNVPSMYQPSANKTTITHCQRRQQRHNDMIRESAADAMKASAARRSRKSSNVEFPAPTPKVYAIRKKRASRIHKWRKGMTQMPHELKWLTYRGPKLSPVSEEENEEQKGGMPRAKRTRVSNKPAFASGLGSFAEETEEEVAAAAKGAMKAPTLSDTLKNNPDYPKLKVPRTRRKNKRSVLGYAPDEEKLGPLGWGGGKKQKRGRSGRKTRRGRRRY